MIQFFSSLKFYFSLFLGMVIYDNEFEKENEILGKIEQQHIFLSFTVCLSTFLESVCTFHFSCYFAEHLIIIIINFVLIT